MGQNNRALKFSTLLLGGLLVATFLGIFLDRLFNTTPIILLILIFYVIIGSFIILVRK